MSRCPSSAAHPGCGRDVARLTLSAMEGPGTTTSASADADGSWSPRSEARRTALRLSQLEELVRRQSTLVESIIRSAAPPRESPGGADRDADAAALAEVAPLTLLRLAATDTSSVRRDLEEELTAAAAESRPQRARQHDARPGAAEASAIARESFPEVYTSMPFLMTSGDAAQQAQTTEERADRWRILSRPVRPRGEEGPRRLYDPDVDGGRSRGAGEQQLRPRHPWETSVET